jgi:hypothetical protein
MRRSIEVWVSRVVGRISPAIKLWAECYPLPIGVVAAKRLYTARGAIYPGELTELLPFQGSEEAYWGLRVVEKRSVLDTFGLKHPTGVGSPSEDPSEYQWLGSFAYSLRGRDDACLTGLVVDGARWWRDFSVERVRGRPRGSGTWESREHFLAALSKAGQRLRSEGKARSQENLASCLHSNVRGLRRWVERFGMSWKDARKYL